MQATYLIPYLLEYFYSLLHLFQRLLNFGYMIV
jgi:hypothetical protein